MHPAFSVLIFTVTSGAGYGLMALLVLTHLTGLSELTGPILLVSGLIALAMISLGLLASTFHLANPKNAWRAFSRFKTSWLSREAVFAVAFYPCALLYLFAGWQTDGGVNGLVLLSGALTLSLALITVFCTGMIYASLKTIRQWHTPLTPLNYLLLGLMTGALWLNALLSTAYGETSALLSGAVSALIVMAGAAKLIYYFWIGKPAGATINTATGFTQARVRLLDTGHTAGTFLTNEFSYEVAANKLVLMRRLVLLFGFLAPLLLSVLVQELNSTVLAYLAAAVAFGGILTERWLFFAEARHVVRLYHGEQRT